MKQPVVSHDEPSTDEKTLNYIWDHKEFSLGGNVDQAYRSSMPDGSRVVVSMRDWTADAESDSSLRQMEITLRELSEQGKFAQLKAIGRVKFDKPILYDGKPFWIGRLIIGMEDMSLSPDGKPSLAWDTGRTLSPLRDLSTEEKIAIRDRLIQLLLLHEDGHPMNVMWRKYAIAESPGYKIDIKLIDPFYHILTPSEQAERIQTERGQYSPEFQKRYFEQELGLAPSRQGGVTPYQLEKIIRTALRKRVLIPLPSIH